LVGNGWGFFNEFIETRIETNKDYACGEYARCVSF